MFIMKINDMAGGLLAVTDEERLLISRAAELSARSENSAVVSHFMTPREQRLVYEAMQRSGDALRMFLWGGYAGAERRAAFFLPSWLVCDGQGCGGVFSDEREKYYLGLLDSMGTGDLTDEHIVPLRLCPSGYVELCHRDWLGALLALGLKRQMLGDILITDGGALLFAKKECADFIISELKRVGRDTVRVEYAEKGEAAAAHRRFERVAVSVASPRLDGAVHALCSLSRDKASELVLSGNVEVNYYTEKRTDLHLCAGDILTVRGYGKFHINRMEDVTRRGRIKLEAEKYV